MCIYLAKRGSTYYFRRAILAELRPAIGRPEFMISLRVKDRDAAKRLIPAHMVATDRQLGEARASLSEPMPLEAEEPPVDQASPRDGMMWRRRSSITP